MRINEVIKTSQENLTDNDIKNYLETINVNNLIDTGYNIDLYKLYKKDKNTYILLNGEKPIAYMILVNNQYGHIVSIAGVSKEYKRKGLMSSMYITLVRSLEYTLISHSEWTKGSEMLWKKLVKRPEINVDVINIDNGENYNLKSRLPHGFFNNPNMRLRAY